MLLSIYILIIIFHRFVQKYYTLPKVLKIKRFIFQTGACYISHLRNYWIMRKCEILLREWINLKGQSKDGYNTVHGFVLPAYRATSISSVIPITWTCSVKSSAIFLHDCTCHCKYRVNSLANFPLISDLKFRFKTQKNNSVLRHAQKSDHE